MLNKELLNKLSKEQSSYKNNIDDLVLTVLNKFDMSIPDFCDVFDIDEKEFNANAEQLYRLFDEEKYNKLLVAVNNKNEDMLKDVKDNKKELLYSHFEKMYNDTNNFLKDNNIELNYEDIKGLILYGFENIIKDEEMTENFKNTLKTVESLLGYTPNEQFTTTCSANANIEPKNECSECKGDCDECHYEDVDEHETTSTTSEIIAEPDKEYCFLCGNEVDKCTCGFCDFLKK